MTNLKIISVKNFSTEIITYKINETVNVLSTIINMSGVITSRACSFETPTDGMRKIYGYPKLMKSAEFREWLKTSCPFEESDKIKIAEYSKLEMPVTLESVVDPENEIFWFNFGGHILFDSLFNPVPTVRRIGYIGSPTTNGYMTDENLEKCRQYFLTRKDILKVSDKIQSIPYYNADHNTTKYIDFTIRPSEEDYKKIFSFVDITKENYSVKVREFIGTPYKLDKFDILNIKQFITKDPYKYV